MSRLLIITFLLIAELSYSQNNFLSENLEKDVIENKEIDEIEMVETGLILYVAKYEECVKFYKEIIGLEELYKKETLTCFEFKGSYLMVEKDYEKEINETEIRERDNTCLRINVRDVKKACEKLEKNAIEYNYNKFEWGEIAKFRDPDRNLIGFRSAKEHLYI